jgi:hypothetical protein
MAMGLDLLRAVGATKTYKSTLDQSSPGYAMMKKMGWEDNTPLGIRGKGIIEPIATKGRVNGDTSGLGMEPYTPVDGEKKLVRVRIVSVGEKYGVGRCEFGTVFIPGGSMRFIRAFGADIHLNDNELRSVVLCAVIVAGKGRHNWRLERVETMHWF